MRGAESYDATDTAPGTRRLSAVPGQIGVSGVRVSISTGLVLSQANVEAESSL